MLNFSRWPVGWFRVFWPALALSLSLGSSLAAGELAALGADAVTQVTGYSTVVKALMAALVALTLIAMIAWFLIGTINKKD